MMARSKIQTVVLALTILSLMGIASPALAYKSAGCGPGGDLFKDSEDDASQIFAATTNWSLFSQMFAITSGTSGCREQTVRLRKKGAEGEEQKKGAALDNQKLFVANNFENVARDLAVGSGEYVSAMAELLGCSGSELGTWSREHFVEINSSSPDALLQSVRTGVSRDAALAGACEWAS